MIKDVLVSNVKNHLFPVMQFVDSRLIATTMTSSVKNNSDNFDYSPDMSMQKLFANIFSIVCQFYETTQYIKKKMSE